MALCVCVGGGVTGEDSSFSVHMFTMPRAARDREGLSSGDKLNDDYSQENIPGLMP